MKTGIIRRVDELGRIVIPKEIRQSIRLAENDSMEIEVISRGRIVLSKYVPGNEVIEQMEVAKGFLDHNLNELEENEKKTIAGILAQMQEILAR